MKLNDYETRHNKFLRNNGAECTVLLKKDGSFPLANSCKIAIFGSGARNTIKGGTGSGEVNSRYFVNVEDGLKNAGFTITSTDWLDGYDKVRADAFVKFKNDIKREAKEKHMQPILLSMGRSMQEPEYDLPIEGEGDTAIYVLSRISGEGADREPVEGEISLSKTEVRDIRICNEKYKNFMLILNVGGVVDLSPVLDVKNILVLSQLGVETGNILADIILGKSNPSGKLTTTWSAWKDYPEIIDFGDMNDSRYKEGIYVGYRYFDTLGLDPLFPFGFGLSYSDFEITSKDFSIKDSKVTVKTTVKNLGSFVGKEVVQLYVSIPSNKLDEPYQMLAGFVKSGEIKPQEEEEVIVSFDMKDIAPFETETMSYILEKGAYIVRVGASSRNTQIAGVVKVKDDIQVLTVRESFAKPDFKDFVPDKVESVDNISDVPVVELSEADICSRAVSYDPEYEIDSDIKALPDDELIRMNLGAYQEGNKSASIIGNAGFTVAGAAGQSYMKLQSKGVPSMVMADGPAGLRLSQLFVRDESGAHSVGTMPFPETMADFLPGIVKFFVKKFVIYRPKKNDTVEEQYCTAIPIGTAIAQSFNLTLAQACGDIVGTEMEMFGVHLWLAPALNIHRSIRCGRNFEYFSEDPYVSGKMAAAITKGVQLHPGCGTTIKHYACNNQEYNRTQNNSQLSERTLREIYLKGFGICVKESQPKAVMTSYNLINGIHTSESRGLIEDVLRQEFGFEGIVMTDWVVHGYETVKGGKHPVAMANNVIMAGGDMFMPGNQEDFIDVKKAFEEGSVTREQMEINATRVKRMANSLCVKG